MFSVQGAGQAVNKAVRLATNGIAEYIASTTEGQGSTVSLTYENWFGTCLVHREC